MKIKSFFLDKEKHPRIWPVIFLFLIANYLISIQYLTTGLIISIFGGVIGFYVIKTSFEIYLTKKRLFLAIIYWMAMLLIIALIFSFLQALAYSKSLGYLKYGGCDSNESFKILSPQEISKLPKVVPFDRTKYIYFNVITMTTLGYGDICPQGDIFRWFSIFEVLIALSINLFFVSIAINRFLKDKQKTTFINSAPS